MRLRVLIAGLDELLLAAYRAFLAAEGVEIITVTNGRDCLASLQRFLPDVLIIDLELPWEPGTGIKALVNEGKGLPAVPVLFLTSRPEKVAEIPAHMASCRFMIKPVPPATVASVVRTLAESSATSQV